MDPSSSYSSSFQAQFSLALADDAPVSITLRSSEGLSSQNAYITFRGALGNNLLDLNVEVPHKHSEAFDLLMLRLGFQSSDAATTHHTFHGLRGNIQALLLGIEDLGGKIKRSGVAENAEVSAVEEISRLARLDTYRNQISDVKAVLFSPGGKRTELLPNCSILDTEGRRNAGVVWIDVGFVGGPDSDQKAYHPSLAEALARDAFPTAFIKDGHAAQRGAADYVTFDLRMLVARTDQNGTFSGKVQSPKLFMLVGEGVIFTFHAGSPKLIDTVRAEVLRECWPLTQPGAGAGLVALRMVDHLQKLNEHAIRTFELGLLQVDTHFRDSKEPLDEQSQCLLANSGTALRYMRTQQGSFLRGLAAATDAALRDNLSDMFPNEIRGRAMGQLEAAVQIASRDADRITGVLDNIGQLLGLNQTRLLEITRLAQQGAEAAARQLAEITARESERRAHYNNLLTILAGVAVPFGLGISLAEVFQNYALELTAAGVVSSAVLVLVGTLNGGISWKGILSKRRN